MDGRADADDEVLLEFFGAIASHDRRELTDLSASSALTSGAIRVAASRQDAERYFLATIQHHVYAGDTALHIAAAAYQPELARMFVDNGADVRARNRRGAEPLHYAADGSPDAAHWDPEAQRAVIEFLIVAGADPNTADRSGVAPLHRAVRNRCSAAVSTLIRNGADPRLGNKAGSTPLHLSVQTTGRSNSGSAAAKEEQRRIIGILLENGARPTDTDAHGKTATDAATSDWVRDLLDIN